MNLECYNDVPVFILYLEAEAAYDGRASSTLIRGNYLVIKKQDGSLLIHGANHVPALNYMSSGSTIRIEGDTITATRRSETITIKVYTQHASILPQGWSESEIQIRKTEAELTDQLAANPQKYLGPGIYTSYREYATLAGPVDLVLTSTIIYIIEVKRRKISLKDCYQLQRYLDAFDKIAVVEKKNFNVAPDCQVIGCLAGPDLSVNALGHCEENEFRYLRVEFEE